MNRQKWYTQNIEISENLTDKNKINNDEKNIQIRPVEK